MASRSFRALLNSRTGLKSPFAALIACFLIFPAVVACGTWSGIHATGSEPRPIKVDQVGYPLDSSKIAFVSARADSFLVRRSSDNAVVYQGKLTPGQNDPNSGDMVEAADFSIVHEAGSYYLDVPGVGRS